MKKIITLVAFVTIMMQASAQKTMRDAFLSMPDSISTGLDNGLRQELVDYAAMNVEAKVKNLFQGTTSLDTINNEYVSVKLNEATNMQMRLLCNSTTADSIICVIKTFMAPEPESEVRFYSLDWKQKDSSYGLPEIETDSIIYEFVERPDTMSVDRFAELCKMIEPVMLAADLSSEEESVVYTLSMPLLNSEERKNVKSILKQRKFKWNGAIFVKNDG